MKDPILDSDRAEIFSASERARMEREEFNQLHDVAHRIAVSSFEQQEAEQTAAEPQIDAPEAHQAPESEHIEQGRHIAAPDEIELATPYIEEAHHSPGVIREQENHAQPDERAERLRAMKEKAMQQLEKGREQEAER